MKQKFMKLVALCLVLACLAPYAVAAEPGVNLWCQNEGIDVNNVVINVGDTISIGCDANDWAHRAAPNHNHTVITVRASGSGIKMLGTKQPGAGTIISITGVSNGRATLTFTIQAGFSEDPDETKETIDQVQSVTSVTIPITVIGEAEPERPEVPDILDIPLQLPTFDIVSADGKVCSGAAVSQQEDELAEFAVALDRRHWSQIAVSDGNGNRVAVYAYDCQYAEDYTGYVLARNNVRWSLNADEDAYQLVHFSDDGDTATASVLCRTGGTTGTLTAAMAFVKVVGGVLTGEQAVVTQRVFLKSKAKEKALVAGELFEKVDVDKVPNPFANLSKSDWYYDAFMSAYAWGLLDGMDFSENQDGSMILSMKKTVFEVSEEKVSSTFVAENKWSAKKLSISDIEAVLHTLGSSPATISLLANEQPKAFVPSSGESNGRGGLVQKVYNVEKSLKGNIQSYTYNPFTDVIEGKSYYQAVLWGADRGIVKGFGGGIFGPNRGITRQEFCTILLRYAKVSGIAMPATREAANFKDAGSIAGWAKEAVIACQKAGIINGYPDGSFRPTNYIAPSEAISMISRFCCN